MLGSGARKQALWVCNAVRQAGYRKLLHQECKDVACFQRLGICVKMPQILLESWIYRRFYLTISYLGVRLKYHLRSTSGSNGSGIKESSPLFGFGPILLRTGFCPALVCT